MCQRELEPCPEAAEIAAEIVMREREKEKSTRKLTIRNEREPI